MTNVCRANAEWAKIMSMKLQQNDALVIFVSIKWHIFVDQMFVDQMFVDEMFVDQMFVDQMLVDEMIFDQKTRKPLKVPPTTNN
jgi:hypothetical protein